MKPAPRESFLVTGPHTVTQEALMLFAPQMAQLLATSAKRRPQSPAAPRTRRRDLLRGLRFPRRSMGRARAVGRLLSRPSPR